MAEQRKIDRHRNAGSSIKIGGPDDQSAVSTIFELDGSMVAVTANGIYKIALPDEIDPLRTNPALPTTQQVILNHGTDCDLVVQTLMTANRLFDTTHLGDVFDRKRGLSLAFEALKDLVAMYETAIKLQKATSVATTDSEAGLDYGRAYFLPSIHNIKGDCDAFIQKADQARNSLFGICKLFYENVGNGTFDGLAKAVEARHGADAGLLEILKKTIPFLRSIRQTRNCVEHPKDDQRIVVQDFLLSEAGALIAPTIEVIDKEIPLAQVEVLLFMRRVTIDLGKTFETMIAALCGHNVRAIGPFLFFVIPLDASQRSMDRVRFDYGLK
jgi:hypothetical protein